MGRRRELRSVHEEPSTPIFVVWHRYTPVMPTRARAAMIIFKELRAVTSVVVIEAASSYG